MDTCIDLTTQNIVHTNACQEVQKLISFGLYKPLGCHLLDE